MESKCFHCSEQIDKKDNFFILKRKDTLMGLMFHHDCFESLAGPEFGIELDKQILKKTCVLCLKMPTVGKKKICENCQVKSPLCPACRSVMDIRINKTNLGLFWGCVNYPACKKTKPVT